MPTAQLVRKTTGVMTAEPNALEQLADAVGKLLARGARAMVEQGVDDLVADPHDRIERVHRALRHERYGRQAHPPHLRFG